MNKPICIYHTRATTKCADGFGAAWVVYHYFKARDVECEFHAAMYNEDPPDVTGRSVYLVDFSYKRDVVVKMLETAKSVTVIDHHKSAIEDLQALHNNHPKFELSSSLDHSGAVLTWNYFYPNSPIPKTLRHIEDYDLWKFSLPGTKEIIAALYSYPFEFATWSGLDASVLRTEGAAILRAQEVIVDGILSQPVRRMRIGGYNVPIINCAAHLVSSVCGALAKGEKFAVSYVDTSEHRVFSLRSTSCGIDVSKIALQYGGGGHEHAAGFRIPIRLIEGDTINWDA